VIDREPRRRLLEVPGIGRARIGAAVDSWEGERDQRATRLFLSSHGVPAAAAARIQRALGAESIELLRADPYRITELDGVGFATADELAARSGWRGTRRLGWRPGRCTRSPRPSWTVTVTCRGPSSCAAPCGCSASRPTSR